MRKSADPTSSRVGRINNISNIIESVERKINDVMNNGRSNERVPSYMLDNFEVNYPYGGYGGIPVVPSSRNQKGSNIRSHNYEHIR